MKSLYYFNPQNSHAIYKFCQKLIELIEKKFPLAGDIVLICIGSDRATGDCLGPIVGYKLSKYKDHNTHIYGTLDTPVHARNLEHTLEHIKIAHPNSIVIAIDASLGKANHVGYVTLGEGSLFPGIGVNKNLPQVGDLFITGIVNISGTSGHTLLQTTRLNSVMQLADFISLGIHYSIHRLQLRSSLECTQQSYFVDAL